MMVQETWMKVKIQENDRCKRIGQFFLHRKYKNSGCRSKNKDILALRNDSYFYKRYYQEQEYSYAEVFTDRSIYRPGQTLYFKSIALKTDGRNKHEVVKDIPLEVSLFDANYQKVSTTTLTTNNFGSVAGSFVIPVGDLQDNTT